MLLSVYIITYNHGKYIAQAIESVLMQKTNFDYEIVIGEDCSTDNTLEIVNSYIKNYQGKIRLINSEANVGAGYNSVRTLKACKGKYIASLEGDDYWITDTKLQKQIDILESDPNISYCFTNRSKISFDDTIIQKDTIPDKYKRTLTASDIIGGFTPPTQTVVFRREHLTEEVFAGLEKVFNGESFAFSYFACKGNVAYLDEITACYRVNDGGIYSGSGYLKKLELREGTFNELVKILPSEHRAHLKKGFNALNQRLYVLYFRNFNIRKTLVRITKMLKFDVKNGQWSFIKANRLLIRSFFIKGFIVTD